MLTTSPLQHHAFRRLLHSAVLALATVALPASHAQAPAAPAAPVRYDLCARGMDRGAERPFVKTVRVKIALEGPSIDDEALRKRVLAQLAQATVFAGQARNVYVEDYDDAACAASLGSQAEIAVRLEQADIDALRGELTRGPGELLHMLIVARRATASIDQASTATATSSSWLRVFYATNRARESPTDAATAFGAARSDQLSYGAVDVAVRNQERLKNLESPAIFKFDNATSLDDFAVAKQLVPLDQARWLAELRQRASRFEKPGTLLFVHGYNVSFVDAARRSAQLAYDLGFHGPTVFFAWPSDASVIKYLYDGRDAENSWGAAASLLRDLTRLQPDGPVYIIAHSMGNRVMLGGLERLMQEFPGSQRAIREVVMAAPDVDQESFKLNIAPKLLNSGPRFTLYASDRDLALSFSGKLVGGTRMGTGGDALYRASGLDSVDASGATKEFFALNHSYFGDKTAVLSDIFLVIREQRPADKRPSLKRKGEAKPAHWLLQ